MYITKLTKRHRQRPLLRIMMIACLYNYSEVHYILNVVVVVECVKSGTLRAGTDVIEFQYSTSGSDCPGGC